MMLRSFKTEIHPTRKQKEKINHTVGTCRFVYNMYVAHNRQRHDAGEPFMSGKDFSVWLNNTFLPAHPEYAWIKDVSSKSVKKSLEDADVAFRKFFKKQAGFPRFKKKHRSDAKMYFVRNNKTDCACERHRIKIPTLGWVWLKEKGYVPTGIPIRSGTVSISAGRYYVSVLVDMPDVMPDGTPYAGGIGIDVGIKQHTVISNGMTFSNINRTPKVKTLEKKLRREQRRLSRKYENAKRDKACTKKNLGKQVLEVQKLHKRIRDIRMDHMNKMVNRTVKTKPSYIAVEDLNVKGMMRNRHLSKAIASQEFYKFREKLEWKCAQYGIELRLVDRFYPSSKTCHSCGYVDKGLKLSERTYRCPSCGYTNDRDLNASLNLRDTTEYRLA